MKECTQARSLHWCAPLGRIQYHVACCHLRFASRGTAGMEQDNLWILTGKHQV